MSLEKAYDKVCREELWRISYGYGMNEYFLIGVKSLYDRYTASVKWGRGTVQHFEVESGSRQG